MINAREVGVAPDEDEVEVTLLGPGYDESVVVHIGHGRWIVVDSCINDAGKPQALEYLRTIGVEARCAVSLIVATHWHDDHIRGMAKLVDVCETADFCCAAALRQEEFVAAIHVGIQVGTAIATLVRKAEHAPAGEVGFRHLWGQAKREGLLETAEAEPGALYDGIAPIPPLGLPFVRTAVSEEWFDWPALPDLFPVSFPGVKTSCDGFLVDVDLDRLRARVADYFNPDLSHEDIARHHPGVMKITARFDARAVRDALLARGGPDDGGFIRFAYRPFDNRWLYWEGETKLLDEKRADYRPHVLEMNPWLVTQQKPRREWSPPQVISHIGCIDLMDRSATCIPTWFGEEGTDNDAAARRPNLSGSAQRWLGRLDANVEDLFHHVLAILHDPAYQQANAGALRMDWPRIPLPGWLDGEADGAATTLARSAARGRALARLLDPATPVPGVTRAPLRPELAAIAVPATLDGRNMR